ncbi:hypothetical protein H1R20_g14655, partial [Candolleomyces eurysporus]
MQKFAKYNLQRPSKEDEEDLDQYEKKCFKRLLDLIAHAPHSEDANRASQWIKQDKNLPELLVLKSTPHDTQPQHVTDAESKPDMVAAFEKDWLSGKDERKVPWGCIRLAGEDASKGKTKSGQMQQAATYLDLLLLARPDFKAAFGLLISEKEFQLLVGIAGDRVYKFTFQWTSRITRQVAYTLVYCLYDFPTFQDSSIIMTHDKATRICTYTFTLKVKNKEDSKPQQVSCSRFICRYAQGSFGTRTHVFVSESLDPPKVAGQPIRVIKDQLCRKETRFNEVGILEAIRRDGPVPGVVELVHEEKISSSLVKNRETVRLGFKQEGDPFMSIKTPQEMLMVAYDALEISRFLHAEPNILHRDFSKGNILCVKDYQKARLPSPVAIPPTQTDQETAQTSSTVVLTDAPLEAQGRKPSFIKLLLEKSDDPQETSTLVIDFNRSEDLKGRERNTEDAADRTGTLVFIARTIQKGGPLDPPSRGYVWLDSIPECPERYAHQHPDRSQKFAVVPDKKLTVSPSSAKDRTHPWRHQLHHDAESIFWVVVYWAILAKPAKSDMAMTPAQQNKTTTQLPAPPGPAWTPVFPPSERSDEEFIPPSIWSALTENWESRDELLSTFRRRALHPSYQSLHPLIRELASYLTTDPYWFGKYNPDDPRTDPEYIHECFQRLILQFVDNNFNKSFMILPIDEKGRMVE